MIGYLETILWLLAGLGLCLTLPAWRKRRQSRYAGMLLFADGDEDMKIAAGPFSAGAPQEDLAEQAARMFLRQKEAGNIDRARDLGEAYARAMLEIEQDPALRRDRPQLEVHHRLLLCSYVINHVIGEYSPNSILAQTTLNVFYEKMEEASPILHQHVSDMAAFSLYILCDRSNIRSEDDIGQVYARLCGREGQPAFIREGNQIYREFYRQCLDKIQSTAYEPLQDEE